jgi:glucan 1,4-alpha-glucosidase
MTALAAALLGLAAVTTGAAATANGPAPPPAASDGPGALSHFDLARKDCVGTARNDSSKVWFTVAGGVLSDVYSPTVDNTNVETLQYVVTDGSTFTDLQARDTTYTVRSTDRSGMACLVTSTARSGRYRILTQYITDPARDSVVMETRLQALHGSVRDLRLYVRYDASVNGNGGGGPVNGGADSATVDAATTALVSFDASTRSQAANRDYGVPLFGALVADRPFLATESGFAGQASDGLTQLDAGHRLTAGFQQARNGNVVQTALVDTSRGGRATLALGFGRTPATAVRTAGASAHAPFERTSGQYADTWREYDEGLRQPPDDLRVPGQSEDAVRNAYWLSANVVKASEDKTFPGAIVAGLASPWGQAVSAGDAPGGLPVYFGSYREVFSRDLYEAFTGLLADGDLATARAATRFLFERQQLPTGELPRNSLVNGRSAPDTGGDQLDESSYPILMALQSGLDHDAALYRDHIRKAADFVVAHGPSFGVERWEEQSGFSPSTIAAEIAGLVAAGRIADENGDPSRARVYRAAADDFQRSVRGWTVTTTGPYATGRYFVRVSKTGDPNAAISYNLGNGSITADQRAVVDAGFLELTRLGELPANDADVLGSLPVADAVIARSTPSGIGYYRYGTSAPGSEDGYGDCWVADPTSCAPDGKPWPTGNVGSGHPWPLLSSERGEQDVQVGNRTGAAAHLAAMLAFAGGVGLVPEQDWEDPNLPASQFGSDPTTASIGFVAGRPAGSADPLTWAQAATARTIQDLGAGRVIEQPQAVLDRYVTHGPPAAAPVTITAPAGGTQVPTATTTVTGTTAAGATVDVASSPTETGGETAVVETTADAAGAFSVGVPTPFGTDAITVAATTAAGATGYAQVTVVSDFVAGTTLLDVADPAGDDSGPGTYAYPTSPDFHPGAFDIQRFQVIDAGASVFLRLQVRDLSPTFGSPLGAQLVDVFVRDPSKAATSTAAPFPSRNYTIAPGSAWSSRLEVQGFAAPVFVDAGGASLGGASVSASAISRFVTVIVPKAALGQPAPGWVFTVVLTGQDGFSADQARGFAATPQPFQFGVCAPGGTSPICSVSPGAVPKAVDVIVPPGVSQAAELDPTRGPVVIQGVPVP